MARCLQAYGAAGSILALVLVVTVEAATHDDSGIRVFPLDYFAEFNPKNAFELVNRTPGFSLEQSDGGRGLSQLESNVLIDGERSPPKGKSVLTLLSELPVRNIERLELIAPGSRPDLDMQGYRQVLNVVTLSSMPPFVEGRLGYTRHGSGDPAMTNGDRRALALRGATEIAGHRLTGSVSIGAGRQQTPGVFAAIDPNDPMPRLTSMTKYHADDLSVQGGGVFDLNSDRRMSIDMHYLRRRAGSEPVRTGDAGDNRLRNSSDSDGDDLSLSAEYSVPLSSSLDASLALIHAQQSLRRSSVLVAEDSRHSSINEQRSGETAARAGLRWQPGHELTLGAEVNAVFNELRGETRVFENGAAQPVVGSSASVTEPRAGTSMNFQWRATPRVVFQGEAGIEVYETRTARTSSGRQRDLSGRLAASASLRKRTSLIIETGHDVEQVSFSQFLASSSLPTSTVTEGASELASPRTWRHLVRLDHRFDDKGVFDVTVSRATTDNPINLVPVSDVAVVAQNTAPQRLDTLSGRLALPLDRIGFAGALLDVSVSLSDSSAIDPVTGDVRPVSDAVKSSWSVGLSKEPNDTAISWGIGVAHQERERTFAFRSLNRNDAKPAWSGFIEWSPQSALTLRTSVRGPSHTQWVSQIFSGIRDSGSAPGFVSSHKSESDLSVSGSLEWRPATNIEFILSAATGQDTHTRQSVTEVGATGQVALQQWLRATPGIGLRFRITN